MSKYGCIGKKLTHSFSKEIHAQLADYEYQLIELSEEEIAPFFRKKDFSAINVTIPYKQTVIPYLDHVSEVAARIGSVNTVVNREGTLFGYNTDYYGMKALIEHAGIVVSEKKVLVLGTGGTSRTARVLAADLGASEIITVSRQKSDLYITYAEAITQHSDADIIINTTPSGMYPDCGSRPIDIRHFRNLEGVIDVVYNPLCTNLIIDAKERGIRAEGGLYMLVMQAVVAVEKFMDCSIPKEVADKVFTSILYSKENIVLSGMPGSGKSTVGRAICLPGFTFVDMDDQIENQCGCTIKELIEDKGEAYFRDLESDAIREISGKSSMIISTGGGAILREENVRCLKQNGKIFFIDAELARLHATDSRPLSDTAEKLKKIYSERIAIYQNTADIIVPDLKKPEEEAAYILEKREALIS